MLLTHLKQAWQLLRQNKLFSTIYIVGTALAITSTTLFGIVFYVRTAPVYPEYKRDRQAGILSVEEREGRSMSQAGMSYQAVRDYIYPMKNADVISAYIDEWDDHYVNFDNGRPAVKVTLKPTDSEFFKVFEYEFIAGSPFSQIDFESGVRKAAISDNTARIVFGDDKDALGQTMSIDFTDYTVCGVFREGSAINMNSFAHVIIPYTTKEDYEKPHPLKPFLGRFVAIMLTDDIDALKKEAAGIVTRYNSANDGHTLKLWQQPESNLTSAFKDWPGDEDFDWGYVVRHNALILLVLLLVPALNLSGMIAGRMDSRNSELGVRKSFGATSWRLISQVLWENMYLTLAGGLLGLLFSWLIMSAEAGWIFASIGNCDIDNSLAVRLTPDMMFAPAVFIFAFLVCLILNLQSALLPAWYSLRRPIIQSLKDK